MRKGMRGIIPVLIRVNVEGFIREFIIYGSEFLRKKHNVSHMTIVKWVKILNEEHGGNLLRETMPLMYDYLIEHGNQSAKNYRTEFCEKFGVNITASQIAYIKERLDIWHRNNQWTKPKVSEAPRKVRVIGKKTLRQLMEAKGYFFEKDSKLVYYSRERDLSLEAKLPDAIVLPIDCRVR